MGCRSVPQDQDAELSLAASVEPTAALSDFEVSAYEAGGRALVLFSAPAPTELAEDEERSFALEFGEQRWIVGGVSLPELGLDVVVEPGPPAQLLLEFRSRSEFSGVGELQRVDELVWKGSILARSKPVHFKLDRWWEVERGRRTTSVPGVTWEVTEWSERGLVLEVRGVHPGRFDVDLEPSGSIESWGDEPLGGSPGFVRTLELSGGGLTRDAELVVTVWREVRRYDVELSARDVPIE